MLDVEDIVSTRTIYRDVMVVLIARQLNDVIAAAQRDENLLSGARVDVEEPGLRLVRQRDGGEGLIPQVFGEDPVEQFSVLVGRDRRRAVRDQLVAGSLRSP